MEIGRDTVRATLDCRVRACQSIARSSSEINMWTLDQSQSFAKLDRPNFELSATMMVWSAHCIMLRSVSTSNTLLL
jgi:hypothetical protein